MHQELREELKALGLPATGVKADLVKRLEESLSSKASGEEGGAAAETKEAPAEEAKEEEPKAEEAKVLALIANATPNKNLMKRIHTW